MQSKSTMSKIVKIGCACAFWGDTESAACQLIQNSQLNYIVFDYLAEITMSIMAGARMKNPDAGYATDFVTRVMEPLIKEIADKKIKVISNAGGINPLACCDALNEIIETTGVGLKIVVVLGDDLMSMNPEFNGENIREMYTHDPFPQDSVSINAYLGAKPISDALAMGADIVITGRVVDSAIVLAPLIYEFNWSLDDYDRLAQGSLAGHIIECGTQCTGGNFTDWHLVPEIDNVGFPIVECREDGSFIVTKPDNTGGLVSVGTVSEQLIYEIGDPRAYILPDVVCDFTNVTLHQVNENRVEVKGARGFLPTDTYKVSTTYPDGFRCSVAIMIGGIDARLKAERTSEAIIKKTTRMFNERDLGNYTDICIEFLGSEDTYGPHARVLATREVVLKIAVTHRNKDALMLFSREIAQAATSMAPGLTNIIGGRPRVMPVIKLFSFLMPKSKVNITIDMDDKKIPVEIDTGGDFDETLIRPEKMITDISPEDNAAIPLVKLAYARSGDKGNHANIGVIARQPSYLPYIRASLSEKAVTDYMAHVLHKKKGKVTRWELPGIYAFNFLLENSLGGGGVASLRIDPQGKAFAQQLLDFSVSVPEALAIKLT